MKRTTLSLLALTSILTLGGCSATASVVRADNEDEPVVVKVAPTSLRLKKGSASLFTGETFQLEPTVMPLKAYNADFEYESLDSDVATVDENGLITSVAPGKTTVRVKCTQNPSLIQDVPVYVADKLPSTTRQDTIAMSNAISKMADKQATECSRPSKVISLMDYNYYLEVEGELKESSSFHRDIIASEPDGYFSMATSYEETHTFGGAKSYGNYRYEIMTSAENYQSFLFYTGDSSKNVLFVNTKAFAEEEGITTYEIVNRILDGLFSTARDIGENVFKYSLNTKYLSPLKLLGSKSCGVLGEDVLIGNIIESGTFSIGTDQESSFEIPAGTSFDAYDVDSFVWDEGYCKRYGILYDWTYELDGKSYHNVTDLVYTFYINEEVGDVELPKISDYHIVEHLYDL